MEADEEEAYESDITPYRRHRSYEGRWKAVTWSVGESAFGRSPRRYAADVPTTRRYSTACTLQQNPSFRPRSYLVMCPR